MQRLLLLILLVPLFTLSAQRGGGRNRTPLHTEISNKEIVQRVYPEATKVEKLNDYWYTIVDDSGKRYGYAMISVELCKDIIGYNGPTPIMLITDQTYIVRQVALMSHHETPAYIRMMEEAGFFNRWNGKALKDLPQLEVDAVSGATLTAIAVQRNVTTLAKVGLKKLPGGKIRKSN
jgi:transcriptional regulator of nitric oxide reductase